MSDGQVRFPKWIQAIEKMPRTKAISIGLGVGCAFSALFWAITMEHGVKPDTMKADWVAAEHDYAKFQNMNPIFGRSSKK